MSFNKKFVNSPFEWAKMSILYGRTKCVIEQASLQKRAKSENQHVFPTFQKLITRVVPDKPDIQCNSINYSLSLQAGIMKKGVATYIDGDQQEEALQVKLPYRLFGMELISITSNPFFVPDYIYI